MIEDLLEELNDLYEKTTQSHWLWDLTDDPELQANYIFSAQIHNRFPQIRDHIRSLESHITSQGDVLIGKANAIEAQARELDRLRNQIANLKDDREGLHSTIQQLEERVKGLESQNDELQKAVTSRDERHENSVAHFDRTKRTIFDQQLEIQQLQQRVKEYAHQVGCYESSLANKDAEISDLQQQVRRLENTFAPQIKMLEQFQKQEPIIREEEKKGVKP